jgi:hypothetical protein
MAGFTSISGHNVAAVFLTDAWVMRLPEWSIPVPGGLDANAIPRGRKLARASVSANPSFAPLGLHTGVAASPHGILLNLPTQSRAGLPLCATKPAGRTRGRNEMASR